MLLLLLLHLILRKGHLAAHIRVLLLLTTVLRHSAHKRATFWKGVEAAAFELGRSHHVEVVLLRPSPARHARWQTSLVIFLDRAEWLRRMRVVGGLSARIAAHTAMLLVGGLPVLRVLLDRLDDARVVRDERLHGRCRDGAKSVAWAWDSPKRR